MSERGSFVTEYIYCDKCLEAAKNILIGNEKHLCSQIIDGWGGAKFMPIIAGKIGGLHPGEELIDFEYTYIPKLEKVLCHNLRIAVLAEEGEQIFIIRPSSLREDP